MRNKKCKLNSMTKIFQPETGELYNMTLYETKEVKKAVPKEIRFFLSQNASGKFLTYRMALRTFFSDKDWDTEWCYKRKKAYLHLPHGCPSTTDFSIIFL